MHVVVLYAPCMFVYRRRFFVTFDLNTRPAGSSCTKKSYRIREEVGDTLLDIKVRLKADECYLVVVVVLCYTLLAPSQQPPPWTAGRTTKKK